MDPQFRRSQTALRTAVYELASTRAPTDISVTELCRAAGVTRETFYRHSASPLELLAATLAAEIDRLPRAWEEAVIARAPEDLFPAMARELLAHVAARADVYRAAMRPSLPSPLRTILEQMMRPGLIAYLQERPGLIPEAVDRTDDFGLGMLASYTASGCVGAIEWWLRGGDLDLDRGVRLLMAATPAFWMSTNAATRPRGKRADGS